MTAKRDSKRKPKKQEPKVKKETLKDLGARRSEEDVKGGRAEQCYTTSI